MSFFDQLLHRPDPWTVPAGVTVRNHEVAGAHGPIPVRSYLPDSPSGVAVVWSHGGGFTHGDLDMLEAHMVCAELAHRTGATLLSIAYRLAGPGVRYPVPLDDVHAVGRAVLAGDFWRTTGLPRPTTLMLGGASAGAALSVAAALRLRDAGQSALDAMLLAYPFLHFPNPAPPAGTTARLAHLPAWFRITPEKVEAMVQAYVGRVTDLPRDAMPGSADLKGLPPTALVVSELDDLAASSRLFERQLRQSAVPVSSFVAAGMPHGHLNMPPSLPGVVDSLDFFARFITSRRRTRP